MCHFIWDHNSHVSWSVMGESESRLGFKSRFELFSEWFDKFCDWFGIERLGFDSIRYFLRFDSKRGIRQSNLSQLLRLEMLR